MKFVSSSAVLALVLLAADPSARQTPGTFLTYGAGIASCTSWTAHLKDPNTHAGDLQWVLGFASAAGVFAGVQLKVDANGIDPFITSYCRDNPAETITTAAATMIGKLQK